MTVQESREHFFSLHKRYLRPLVIALEGDVNYTSEFIIATFENTYSEADESGKLEVRTISDNG